MSKLRAGDHVVADRCSYVKPNYYHHGIYIGEGRVIHFHKLARRGKRKKAIIRTVTLNTFADGDRIFRVKYRKGWVDASLAKTVRRAKSKLGENDYSLILSNCEHFAVWCKTLERFSEQVVSLAFAAPPLSIIYESWDLVDDAPETNFERVYRRTAKRVRKGMEEIAEATDLEDAVEAADEAIEDAVESVSDAAKAAWSWVKG